MTTALSRRLSAGLAAKALGLGIVTSVLSPVAASALIPGSQRNALLRLYESTSGPEWSRRAGWLGPAGTECSWQHVVCNDAQTEVLALELQDNHLVGPLPEEIGGLANLVTLHLESNQISGPIPASLGDTGLVYLAAGDNQLSGAIPDRLWQLGALENLDLRNNQLEGSLAPAVGNLTHLLTLRLDNNRLSGRLPGASLANLQGLQVLFLSRNQFSGEIPAALGDLASLRELRLDQNRLTGAIPAELANARSLVVLELGANDLTGIIPPQLGSLSSLQQLSLGQCLLTGAIPSQIGNLGALKLLSLGTNLLDGAIPESLGNLQLLEELYLDTNLLSGPVPQPLGSLPALRVMHLYRNQLTGEVPQLLPASLTSLRLDGNRLEGAVPTTLGSLANLQELRLASNKLGGVLPSSLLALSRLQAVDLRWNAVHASDSALGAFLDSRAVGEPFASTQTLAPTGITAAALPPQGALVRWTPPSYVAGSGGYQIEWALAPDGPYTTVAGPADKTAASATLQALPPDAAIFLRMKTFTNPHSANQNSVFSETSLAVAATTGGAGSGVIEWLVPTLSAVEGELKTVTVVRTGGSDGSVSVGYRTGDGSAVAPDDYQTATGTLSWLAGEAGARTLTFSTVADAAAEASEQALLVLEGATGGAAIREPSTATVEIRDRGLDDLIGQVVSSSGAMPAIAADPAGNRVVVWQDREEGGGRGVFGASFDVQGNPIGATFMLNEPSPTVDESNPTITPLGVESFLAAWEDAAGSAKARRVAIKVRIVELSGVFTVAAAGSPRATSPALAKGAPGEVFAAWRRGDTVSLRRLSEDGTPLGAEEILTETAAPLVDGPVVAREPQSGNVLVSWSAQHGPDSDVMARRASSTGVPLAHELRLNQDPRGNQRKPTVVAAADGSFLAAWQSDVQAGSFADQSGQPGTNVIATILPAADGAPPGAELRLNTTTSGSHFAPTLASVADGDCVAAWITEGAGGPAQARGRRLEGCRTPGPGEEILATAEPGSPVLSVALGGAAQGSLTAIRSSADVVEGDGKIAAAELAVGAHSCTSSPLTLCLLAGRLSLQVFWRNQHGDGVEGQGRAVPYSDGSGYFWLFAPETLEVAVKAIDGTAVNGHFWVFTASLSDVEYWLIVTDTVTGISRTFRNPPGHLCGLVDVAALPGGAGRPDPALPGFSSLAPAVWPMSGLPPPPHVGPCLPTATTLCMGGGRFEVIADWSPGGTEPLRPAATIPVSAASGFFSFFGPQLLELGVKLLDAQALTGSYWFFYSSLTDRRFRLTVRDTLSGRIATYENPQGEYCGRVDFDLFGGG